MNINVIYCSMHSENFSSSFIWWRNQGIHACVHHIRLLCVCIFMRYFAPQTSDSSWIFTLLRAHTCSLFFLPRIYTQITFDPIQCTTKLFHRCSMFIIIEWHNYLILIKLISFFSVSRTRRSIKDVVWFTARTSIIAIRIQCKPNGRFWWSFCCFFLLTPLDWCGY